VTGTQPYVKILRLTLSMSPIYSKTGKAPSEERDLFCPADAGIIKPERLAILRFGGIGHVVRGLIDRPALAKIMKLSRTRGLSSVNPWAIPESDRPIHSNLISLRRNHYDASYHHSG